ncbi:hypothetical protein E3P94_03769 [Wallemia ichthyophaga]|nr:hypothetical protein E3P95_03760 [Wallemia ichthyophaga]TIA96279.1 hypothetical protein E3P94_03769 [Wallemia ichthyophaga]
MPPRSSRKGKKEWRKNANTGGVDDALNAARDEAVVYGSALENKPDDSLFAVDLQGDAETTKRMKKEKLAKPLKSLSILQHRSAVPAPALKQHTRTISKADKDRLNTITKKKVSGPLGATFASQQGDSIATHGLTKAAKEAGQYDLWDDAVADKNEDMKKVDAAEGFEVVDLNRKPSVRLPSHPHYHTGVEPVEKPHAGQSYNPDSKSHEELLRLAYEREQLRKLKADKNAAVRRRYAQSKNVGGMELDVPESGDEEEESEEGEESDPSEEGDDNLQDDKEEAENDDDDKDTSSATIRDKMRIADLREAKRRRKASLQLKKDKVERERTAFLKAQKHDIYQATGISKSLVKKLRKQQEKAEERKLAAAVKASGAGGFEGRKIGRHVVPSQEVDVTLGEDLSESLRGVKSEGNLFRDRFMSLQKRALVEPRQPVSWVLLFSVSLLANMTPSAKRKYKLKEYETPAFRFWEKR